MSTFPAEAVIFLIPVVGAAAFFAFLSVASWADQRRRERESYYRYEFRKQLVEAGQMNAEDVRQLMEFEHHSDMYRTRNGSLMAAFILLGVGIGLLIGLRFIEDEAIWMVGFIPLFIGLAMLVYAGLLAPRTAPTPPPSFDRPRNQP